MKKLSPSLLAQIVSSKRKELNMTQKQLSDMTGINRPQLSKRRLRPLRRADAGHAVRRRAG